MYSLGEDCFSSSPLIFPHSASSLSLDSTQPRLFTWCKHTTYHVSILLNSVQWLSSPAQWKRERKWVETAFTRNKKLSCISNRNLKSLYFYEACKIRPETAGRIQVSHVAYICNDILYAGVPTSGPRRPAGRPPAGPAVNGWLNAPTCSHMPCLMNATILVLWTVFL